MGFLNLLLKGSSWFLRFVEFCCATIILGIFAYFISALRSHHQHVPTWIRAVTGISGAAMLYTLFALFLVFCLGGIAIFSAMGMLLDLAFLGAFIYLAYATRHGSSSCSGNVNTPLGSGNTNTGNQVPFQNTPGGVHLPSLKTSCRLNKACFAVAIVGLVFFFLSIFAELALIWNRRRQKTQAHDYSQDHTEKRRLWQRKPKRDSAYTNDSIEAQKRNADNLPSHTTPGDMRQSYQTDTTAVADAPAQTRYAAPATAAPAAQNARTVNQTTAGNHPAHIGQANQAGYSNQQATNTRTANARGAGMSGNADEYGNRHDSYLHYSPQGAPSSYPHADPRLGTTAEMPGEHYAQGAPNAYRTYNPTSSRDAGAVAASGSY